MKFELFSFGRSSAAITLIVISVQAILIGFELGSLLLVMIGVPAGISGIVVAIAVFLKLPIFPAMLVGYFTGLLVLLGTLSILLKDL